MSTSDRGTLIYGWHKARVTMTGTNDPAPVSLVREAHGRAVKPAPEEGWWWLPCTESAFKNIDERGHHAIGTVTTTYIPPLRDRANARSESTVP